MRCGNRLPIIMVPVIQRIGPRQINQRSKVQAILHRRLRDKLPHPLRVPFACLRPADVRVEVALLHGQIKELRRKSLVQKLFSDRRGVVVLTSLGNRSFKPA